jgi:hypothetical protein
MRIKWMYELSQGDSAGRRAHPMPVQPEPTSTLNPPLPTHSEIPPKPAPNTWSDRALGALSYIIPLSRIPDEQFLADLRRRKDEVNSELEKIQKQLEAAQSNATKHDIKSPLEYENKK